MSERPPVDRARIETFLDALGRRTDVRGRLYLVGGTTLVYAGVRARTLDIDIALEVDPADHGPFVRAVRDLKDKLQVNVEEASPADFIPLPAGSRDRARYVGRYGRIDVFHFDPYSTALSKVARGREEDYADILALLRADWLDWDRLVELFEEVRPRMATESLKGDADEFARHFDRLRAMWRGAP